MPQILAPGLAAATSSTFVLVAGQEVTVSLFSADGTLPPLLQEDFHIEKLASNGQWIRTGVVLTALEPVVVLAGSGTFRVSRALLETLEGVGVDLD